MSEFGDGNQMVFACDHVLSERSLVRLVVHDEDGKWTFMCGSEADNGDELHYVPLRHVLERDPSIESIASLDEGMVASRAAEGEPWDQDGLYEDS